jgi:membrane-bound ClpP family serine protease
MSPAGGYMRPALKFVAQVVIMFGLIGLAGSIMFLVGELSSGDTPVALYGLTADLALTLLAGVVVILAEIAERLESHEEISVSTANPTSIIAPRDDRRPIGGDVIGRY